MLKIFVCEDDQKQREEIEMHIKYYIMIMNYDAKLILSTANPLELLRTCDSATKGGLYFLDIELEDSINGIELGAQIKKVNPDARIVYITSHAELSYLTFVYKVEAMDYIIKSSVVDIQKRVQECIDMAVERFTSPNSVIENSIMIHSGERDINLPIETVLFFETTEIAHKLKIHCDNRLVEFYGNIKDCEEMSEYFIRCHKSYVINLLKINEVNKSNRLACFRNGQVCPISKKYYKSVMSRFENIL